MNDQNPKSSCNCATGNGPTVLVYSCSGAADVGEIADRTARRLQATDSIRMSCLAGIGGRVSGLMANATAAPVLLALDGCPHDCARKTLALAGFDGVRHVRVTDLGFLKGKTPATEEVIAQVLRTARSLIPADCSP